MSDYVTPSFHIVVIQSAIIANQVLQQLRLNENASHKYCNSIGDQSATAVEVESGSTSTTITTVADKSTFNENISCQLSATETCHIIPHNAK